MGCDDADRGVHVLDHAMTERVAGVRTRGKLLFWVRVTTPRSSRQDDPAAIDDLYPGSRARRSPQRAIAQRFSALARLVRHAVNRGKVLKGPLRDRIADGRNPVAKGRYPPNSAGAHRSLERQEWGIAQGSFAAARCAGQEARGG